MFGSAEFFWLWIAQLVSATGDWLGLLAIISLADRISEGSEGTAIAHVLAARVAPGFFLATAAGVLVDRLNRKHVMITCDIGRAVVLVMLPFVDTLAGLVVASFILEILTMLWSPAKEATVPKLVPRSKLTSANSLNVAAAYGMFPVAAGIGALLAKAAEKLPAEGWVDTWQLNEEGLAFYVDSLTFVVTAIIVWRIAIPARSKEERRAGERGSWDLGGAVRELREGWHLIAVNPIVRAVNVGLATGVMGGGMLVPLGAIFVHEVIDGTDADFQLVLFALGLGMAVGVICASVLQNRLNRSSLFPVALIMAGTSLFVAASSELLTIVVPVVWFVGFWAGPIYVLGFTLLHENVDDDMRGRIFSALLVLVRLCMLIALAVAPLLSDLLDGLADDLWGGEVELLGMTIPVPGVRITMWLASAMIVAAGVLATWSLRAGGVKRDSLLTENDQVNA
jgi:dTMP kinase